MYPDAHVGIAKVHLGNKDRCEGGAGVENIGEKEVEGPSKLNVTDGGAVANGVIKTTVGVVINDMKLISFLIYETDGDHT